MMHLLEIIQYISLFVMVYGMIALSIVIFGDTVRSVPAASTPVPVDPIGLPRKGRHKPCAECRKAIVTYRYLNEGRTIQEIANYFGVDVPRLQKLLDKHGKAARREMEARA